MESIKEHFGKHGRTYGGLLIVLVTLAAYALAIHLSYTGGFRGHFRRTNIWALCLSLLSVGSLLAVYGFLRRWVPSAAITAETPSLLFPRRQHVVGLLLGVFFVAICLPATLKSFNHPREVQVFWVDEGDILSRVQAYVIGDQSIPEYRFSQGWVTFLPVALLLKGLHQVVPVEYALTTVALRCYLLSILFGIVYCTYRLIWQVSRSWWLAAAVVAIAYSRFDFFHINLAIDRPDPFQLLFVLLSLIFTHRFWVAGQTRAWFYAVFFAAFAFASKYSGHLLTPVLLISFVAHLRRPEMQIAFPSTWKRWVAGAAIFSLSLGLIFPFTFFTLSPYHLCFMESVVDFFQTMLAIYKNGNTYNLPDLERPSHIVLWWGVFTSTYAFDTWLTVLGLAGAGAALVKNLVGRAQTPRARGEWLLLAWGACYFSFLVYQYGLVDYRYIMPAQYVLPFFMLAPILWLQESTVVGRVPYRTALGFCTVGLIIVVCNQRMGDTLRFLAKYRSEASVQQCFDVGHYFDRTIPADEDPRILLTNVAYIPPRFTRLEIRNVDISTERMNESRFDYVVMTDNMYAIYANKPTKGHEEQYDPLYKVHYVDVVDTYTKFKNNQHPDYQYVKSFQDFHIFERVDRTRSRAQFAGAR